MTKLIHDITNHYYTFFLFSCLTFCSLGNYIYIYILHLIFLYHFSYLCTPFIFFSSFLTSFMFIFIVFVFCLTLFYDSNFLYLSHTFFFLVSHFSYSPHILNTHFSYILSTFLKYILLFISLEQ